MRPAHSLEAQRPPGGPTPSPIVGPDVQRSLLELARIALAVATRRDGVSALDRAVEQTPGGDEPGEAFVTLTEDGDLRGCMGSLEPERSLREAVVVSAISAALDDPRFRPVTAEELPAIHVDISVLGPLTAMADPGAFQPGVDGVIVERSGRRGLLLPEVATEFHWTAPQMFDAVCRKAGLPRDTWRDPRTRLSTFRTVRFGGPATSERETAVGRR
jgi:AmmeMemoRadiSam system protein A